jgi:hypothetical protein
LRIIQVQVERKRARRMMMWRMTPIGLHPKLLLMAVGLQNKKIFDVEEIIPTSYMHMGIPIF